MITFALLWAVLFAALLGWADLQGRHLLIIRSRRARQALHAAHRNLLPAERQALTREFHLALPEGALVYRQTGSLRLVGWRTPLIRDSSDWVVAVSRITSLSTWLRLGMPLTIAPSAIVPNPSLLGRHPTPGIHP